MSSILFSIQSPRINLIKWFQLNLIISLTIVTAEPQPASMVPLMTQFDSTWDAMKCAMKIGLIQMAKYHNNQMSCCGLWMAKWFIKSSAEEYCERSDNAKAIFDQYINGDLIYNQMVRSVLGDDQLSCDPYPEGSPACTRLWLMILIFIIIALIFVFLIITCCCCTTILWCRTSKENHRLKTKLKGIESPHTSSSPAPTAPPIVDANNDLMGQNERSSQPNSAKQLNGKMKKIFLHPIQVQDSSSYKVPIPIEDSIPYDDNQTIITDDFKV